MPVIERANLSAIESNPALGIGKTTDAPSRLAFFLLLFIFVIFNTVFVLDKLPSLPLGMGADLYPQDIILFMLLVIGTFRRLNRSAVTITSPVSKYIVFFLLIVFIDWIYSIVVLHEPLLPSLVDLRMFTIYLVYFPVIWSLGTEKGVTGVVKIWTILAIGGALLYLYQFFFGELAVFQHHVWLYSKTIELTVGAGSNARLGSHVRSFVQGTVLFRTMLFVSLCLWLFSRDSLRWFWAGTFVLLGIQVILQFTRGMYVTSLLVFMILPFFVRDHQARRRLMTISLIGIFLFLAGFFYYLTAGFKLSDYQLTWFTWERFSRALTNTLGDESLQGRVKGTRTMLTLMRGNWLFGLGMGSGLTYGDGAFVGLLIKTGVPGLIACHVIYVRAILRAMSNLHRLSNPIHRAVLLGLFVSIGRHLINGITQSDLISPERIAALIVSVALMEILIARGGGPFVKDVRRR